VKCKYLFHSNNHEAEQCDGVGVGLFHSSFVVRLSRLALSDSKLTEMVSEQGWFCKSFEPWLAKQKSQQPADSKGDASAKPDVTLELQENDVSNVGVEKLVEYLARQTAFTTVGLKLFAPLCKLSARSCSRFLCVQVEE
jgi:hypothetical protein